jgi:ABC-type phosphate transport system permease subunit
MKCFRKQGGRKGMGRKGNTEIIDSFSCTKQSAVRSIIRCVIIAWFRAVCTAMAVFLLIMNMGYHSISEAGNTKASSRQGACSESESSSECKSKDQSEPASGDGMRN